MSYERSQNRTGIERVPFQQRLLGHSAQLFFKFPGLFKITSEPILDLMPIGIYISDKRGHLYYANPAIATILGYENSYQFKQEVLENGGLQSIYSDSSQREKWIQQYTPQQEDKEDNKQVVSELNLRRRDGSIITVRDTSVQIGNDIHGQPVYFGGIQDITDEVKMREQLEQDAKTDSLTGLLNRRGHEEQLEYEIKRASRQKKPLSIIMIDIDHFKNVNDTYGHPNGDLVLQGIATEVRKNVRGIDFFARWGGEEFIITLPGTDKEGAFIVAEKIRDIVANLNIPICNNVQTIKNTVSVGVAQWSADMTIEQLEEIVDRALYAAKERGRNQSIIFVEGMERRQIGNGHVVQ